MMDAELSRMEFGILGPLACHRNGEAVDLGVFKQRAVLALLLLSANQVVSTDKIMDEVWGEDTGKDHHNALWVNISRLRTALEPAREKRADGTVLLTRSPGYMLSVDPSAVDSSRFEALALEGRSLLVTDPAAASLVLSEALALWRGYPLEDFTYESFAQAEIARLTELRLDAVENRVAADLRVGRSRELIGELESLVRQHPLRERLTEQLMVSFYRSNRKADALRAFGNLEQALVEELGLNPSDALRRLEERVLLDDPSLRQPEAALILGGRPEPGLAVRGYELREKIGESSLGAEFRAYQPAIGREVTVTLIGPDRANNPDFIRRFETEAHLLARLEHPRIATLLDYWREPDNAFLVMRTFEGGSLQQLLDTGPLHSETAARILHQIAEAITAAHTKGLIHGAIDASCVLLDADSNAHLAGFGLALGESEHRVKAGDSEPVPWTAGLADRQGDLAAFATLADRTLWGSSGRRSNAEDPTVSAVAGVIARATSRDAADRFTDAELLFAALAEALAVQPAGEEMDAENPYRGLLAFEESDADRFFGRERLVERLLARLGNAGPPGRLAVLTGPSGAGKSSVVRAGVIPALKGGALPGSERWFFVTATPGKHPFEAVERALQTVARERPPDLLDELKSVGISSAVRSVIPDETSKLVLVVDQLEELFSHAEEAVATAFLTALAAVAADRHSPVKIITTLRADFYDHPLRHDHFGEHLRLGTEVIAPMKPEELERAISAPAAAVGVSFEAGLVAAIVSDMAGQPAALPLMQYALTELFENRSGPMITVDDYRRLGGVGAALVRRADSIYDSLDRSAQAWARELFLRLVTVGDGTSDTRRRAPSSELIDNASTGVEPVLDAFGRHRLLTFDRDPVTRAPTVEIAHEALLDEWVRLRRWIEDARSELTAQRRLATASAGWREGNRDPGFLLTGQQFNQYRSWTTSPPVRLSAAERDFLEASARADADVKATERLRVQRLRRLLAATATIAILAVIAGGVALRQRQAATANAAKAETAATEADLERLRAVAAATASDDPTVAALLAVEANRLDPSSVESLDTLHQVLTAVPGFRASLPGGPYVDAELLDDGVTLLALAADQTDVWDLDSGERIRTMSHEGGSAPKRIEAADGGRLAAVGGNSQVTSFFDPTTGEPAGSIKHEAVIDDATLSPSGSTLAAVRVDGEVEIWDAQTLQLQTTLDTGTTRVLFARWSPTDGHLAVVTADAEVQLWNPSVPERLWTFTPPQPDFGTAAAPHSALFTSDGDRLVIDLGTVGAGQLRVLETSDGQEAFPAVPKMTDSAESPGFPLDALYWIDESRLIVGAPEESGARAYHLSTGEPGPPLIDKFLAIASDFVFSPELEQFVVVGPSGIELWSNDGTGPLERRVPLPPEMAGPLAANNGSVLSSLAADGSQLIVSVLALPEAVPVRAFDLKADPITSQSYDPAAGGLTVGYGPNTLITGFGGIQLLDPSGEPLGPPVPFPFDIADTAASHDGRFFAVGRLGGFVDLYTGAGQLVSSLTLSDAPPTGFTAPTFSADGGLIAASIVGEPIFAVWSTDTHETLDLPEAAASWADLRLTGNGLLGTRTDSDLVLIDPYSYEQLSEPLLNPPGRVTYTTTDLLNGRLAAAGGNSVKIWDLETGLQFGRELPYQSLRIEYTEDGSLLSVPGDGHVSLWNYDTDTWVELACKLAGRNLTPEEWRLLGPQSLDHRATCPQYPLL